MNNTYYISQRRGHDSNDGRTPQTPWQSLRKLRSAALGPGDRVLLERGSVFEDSFLHLRGISGSGEAPVVIDAYGSGELPAIHANGQGVWYQDYGKPLDSSSHRLRGYVSSAVLLYDCDHIELRNLAVTNLPPETDADYNDLDTMNRTGVAVVAQNRGTLTHIHLIGLDVRDVYGNVYDKHMNNGGIYFTVFKPKDESATDIPRYDDLLIEGCHVENVNRWGIAAAYTAYWEPFGTAEISDETAQKYGATRVVIRGNYVKDPGGDAITTMYCWRPLVEHNISDGAARQINKRDYSRSNMGRVAAAVWPWKCKNAVFQYNEVFNTRYHNGENQDGQAFDADYGDGTVYQYNYSHDNEGGTLMICGVEAVNTVFRYNICQNDSRAALLPASSPLTRVYNNVFYMKPEVPFIDTNSDAIGPMELKNNIILCADGTPKAENWYEDRMHYAHNLFGNYETAPAGENILADPKLQDPGQGRTGTPFAPALDSLEGYRLRPESPARGSGEGIPDAPEKDFFGNPAAAGNIGADQTV